MHDIEQNRDVVCYIFQENTETLMFKMQQHIQMKIYQNNAEMPYDHKRPLTMRITRTFFPKIERLYPKDCILLCTFTADCYPDLSIN